jgi:drug/metabolite transporter (DMT)-like permease
MRSSGSRLAYRNSGGLTAGLIVTAIGALFLLDNFGISFRFMEYHNWWALFILIGAAGPLSYAVQRYRTQGRLDGAILHSLVSTAAVVTVALMFLFDLSWNLWWPLFIIFGGLWMLANNWRCDSGASSS